MYKSKLQEYCQSKAWKLPEYSTTKDGLDHCPQFKATVIVNGSTFSTPHPSKSSKEAQNMVAKLALDHLTGSLGTSSTLLVTTPTLNDVQHSKSVETLKANSPSGLNSINRDDKKDKDMIHLYKSQLQIYAQKKNLALPVYVSEHEGPPHARRFKSKVMLAEKTYESLEYYSTIKDAENAAAKVALTSVSSSGIEEEDPGFIKNLLQELAQKEYSCLPEYNTTGFGASHMPIFVSTVEIKGECFKGREAKTKKLAEMNAAKIAYTALKERKCKQIADPGSPISCVEEIPDSSSLKLEPLAMAESQQGTIDEPKWDSSDVLVEQARSNKVAHQKGRESKYVMLEREANTNFDQNPAGVQPEGLGFSKEYPLGSAVSGHNIINIEQSTEPDAFSSYKKVSVYPRTPGMTFPPGFTVMHSDEKWVAVTSDSIHGNGNASV